MPKIHRDRPPTNAADVVAQVPPQAPTDEFFVSEPVPIRPARKASKSAWVAYAAALGADASGTKAQIIKRVG